MRVSTVAWPRQVFSGIPAAEEEIAFNPAEDQIGVGYRRLAAAPVVARRSGVGAGTLRSHFHHSAGIDPAMLPPPEPISTNRERRNAEQPFAGLKTRHDARLVAFDQAGLARGAAHIK
jgi:hypothetical protein